MVKTSQLITSLEIDKFSYMKDKHSNLNYSLLQKNKEILEMT